MLSRKHFVYITQHTFRSLNSLNTLKPRIIMTEQKQTFCSLETTKINFANEEEKIIKYWREIDAFKQQLIKSKDKKPWNFFDGPPFATGKPRMISYINTFIDIKIRFYEHNK